MTLSFPLLDRSCITGWREKRHDLTDSNNLTESHYSTGYHNFIGTRFDKITWCNTVTRFDRITQIHSFTRFDKITWCNRVTRLDRITQIVRFTRFKCITSPVSGSNNFPAATSHRDVCNEGTGITVMSGMPDQLSRRKSGILSQGCHTLRWIDLVGTDSGFKVLKLQTAYLAIMVFPPAIFERVWKSSNNERLPVRNN